MMAVLDCQAMFIDLGQGVINRLCECVMSQSKRGYV
jgi:hypothetical protein